MKKTPSDAMRKEMELKASKMNTQQIKDDLKACEAYRWKLFWACKNDENKCKRNWDENQWEEYLEVMTVETVLEIELHHREREPGVRIVINGA